MRMEARSLGAYRNQVLDKGCSKSSRPARSTISRVSASPRSSRRWPISRRAWRASPKRSTIRDAADARSGGCPAPGPPRGAAPQRPAAQTARASRRTTSTTCSAESALHPAARLSITASGCASWRVHPILHVATSADPSRSSRSSPAWMPRATSSDVDAEARRAGDVGADRVADRQHPLAGASGAPAAAAAASASASS